MKVFTRSQMSQGARTHFVVLSTREGTITLQARKEELAEIFADLLVAVIPAFTTTDVDRVH